MKRISEYDAYSLYMAIKLHFESKSYDAIKYNYKTSVTPNSFWKRRDKYQFAKIAKKFDSREELINFYVANFVSGQSSWIGNMLEEESLYTDWKRKMESLSYLFNNDIQCLSDKYDSFDDLFRVDNNYPNIINEYLEQSILLETVTIVNKLTKFLTSVKVSDTILYPDIKSRIQKYESFVSFDRKKAKAIILKHFTS